MAFWNAAQSSNDCDAVRAYLQRFPRGIFVELAKLSERRLCTAGRKVSVTEPTAAEAASSNTAVATLAPAVPTLAPPPPVPDVTVARPAPVAVAAVPGPVGATPSSTPIPGIAPSATDLTRTIQLELYRLGCSTSEANGKWTVVTREGLRKFNLRTKSKLDTNEPSSVIVAALQKQTGRACPLECGRGMVARGETCVAVAKPEPKKQTRRAERSTRSAETTRVRQPKAEPAATSSAAAAPQPSPSPAPMMMGPPLGGMMFFGFGGRRRF
jgi:hypothetical protein